MSSPILSLIDQLHSIHRVDSTPNRIAYAKDARTFGCPAELLEPPYRPSVPDSKGAGLPGLQVTPADRFVSLMKNGLLNTVLLLEMFFGSCKISSHGL